jgi:cytochrome subunit of sulfide dehydrogenase
VNIEFKGNHCMIQIRQKSKFATIFIASLALFTAATAFAQTKDELYVASVAATCATCHGTLGKAVNGSPVVSLAGLSKDYIVAQMAAFKSGARPATVMHQLSKGYSDAQIAQIATYFAAQKP